MAKPVDPNQKVIATNRKARRDYDVLETIECGIVLRGSEVKSLREAQVQFADANGWVRNGELWLMGLHVAPYARAGQGVMSHEPDRGRKLLAHRDEIRHLKERTEVDRLALIPLSLYFKDGNVKVEMAVARGRKHYDKRQALAERDATRDTQRAMANARTGKQS